ncbi:hypothetical protein D4639_002020 [Escherichia coli]|uniref:hypothetical protein n=1 Tax=Escherichia coli TaxID=562 RepID=UPI00111BBE9E|nr:hypothetical protein [Escherichia coli]EEW8235252.1 hypothetical protein [Escherichia coli]EJE8430209.1 hypothetical protein [Escherichia coli]EJI2102151.1 hypothetical protein [Escherichia coli]EJT9118709.1 hypothetical protein [Escherichia coli]TNH65317.1 hypothetical protein FG869_06275 [Escherichia coli]
MFRFRRVNIDGKSITETRLAGAELKPGELVKLEGGKFVKATTAEGRLYIVNPAFHEGKTIADAIAAGETVVADYVEEGREFAMRVEAATYAKDQAIKLGEVTVAYCQEDVTLEDVDFIRVRVA